MRILILLIFFLVSLTSFGQLQKNSTTLNKKDSLIQGKHSPDESLNMETLIQSVMLEERNKLLEITLASNNNIFDSISAFLAVLALFLTVVGISIPLLNYFYVIKPNKKLAKKLKKLEKEIPARIEKDFELFYKNFEKNKFKAFLKELTEENNYENLTNFVNDNHPFFKNFESKDQQIVIKYLKNNPQIETSALPALNRILMDVQSEVSTLFYKETFELDDNQNYKFALKYLIDEGSSAYYNFLKKEIINSSNGHRYMLDILEFSFYYYFNSNDSDSKKTIGIKIIKLYFGNKEICESLKNVPFPEPRKNHYSSSNILVATNFKNKPDITNTCYYKSFLESRLTEPIRLLRQ